MSASKADYFPCIETIYFIGICFFFLLFSKRRIPVFFLLSFLCVSPFFCDALYFFSFFLRRRVLRAFALTVLKQNLSTLQFVKYADGAAFTYWKWKYSADAVQTEISMALSKLPTFANPTECGFNCFIALPLWLSDSLALAQLVRTLNCLLAIWEKV